MESKNGNIEIGIVGLGVMGKSLALNLADSGISVAVYNRHVPGEEEFLATRFAADYGESIDLYGFDDLETFVTSLKKPRNILLMIKAGPPIDRQLEELLPYLDNDDLVMDGGNSHFKDTSRRAEWLQENDMRYLGLGISGGEEGARYGASVMPGGSEEAYRRVEKYLETIAAQDKDGKPCCSYIGPEGAGHFVKMMHNGIEYAEMQLIAEAYDLLRHYAMLPPDRIAGYFEEWNSGETESYLLEITVDILKKKEEGNFLIDKIRDQSEQKGTGGWSTVASIELGMPTDTISEAVMARFVSSFKDTRLRAEGAYGLEQNQLEGNEEGFIDRLHRGYDAFRIINHAIGFSVLQEADNDYSWDLDLSEIARIWTNGCIIRSGLMEQLVEWMGELEERNLLEHPEVINRLKQQVKSMSGICGEGLENGYSLPVSTAALNYFLSYIRGQLPTNLTQAQRDYFGAHTYQRIDRSVGEHFHTNWKPESYD